jgi:pimeloyl-ACP methyl ester carboxylesterase
VTDDVVLLPSLGRPARDFANLVARLTSHGFTCWPLDPVATVPAGFTLFDLARDTARRLDDVGVTTTHLIGHAFGNRLARALTVVAPDRVRSLTLLAAGGHAPIPAEVSRALAHCFSLPPGSPEHLEAVRTAFFAPGHDPSVWADGWNPAIAEYQRAAVVAVEPAEWWDAVAPRVLVVQGLDDVIASPENGRHYVRSHRDIATLVEIPDAGHAMIVEQPDAVADAVLAHLRARGGP